MNSSRKLRCSERVTRALTMSFSFVRGGQIISIVFIQQVLSNLAKERCGGF
ncbi:unnamed protein product [Hymenolepis diminuta]|uniref:Uncharacterized protein n=1 Tax=Hymenolepis diminuta TaxID=6216 RepID=A0A564Z061_HYMDI|nr:unnamed protein product [Hymenolepis diminuta]